MHRVVLPDHDGKRVTHSARSVASARVTGFRSAVIGVYALMVHPSGTYLWPVAQLDLCPQVNAPHGATEYVRAAVEFANWAFMTDEEHDAAAAARTAVNATLAATQRMQTLCDYSLHSAVPESVPAALPAPPTAPAEAAQHAASPRAAASERVVSQGAGQPHQRPGAAFVDENTGTVRDSGSWCTIKSSSSSCGDSRPASRMAPPPPVLRSHTAAGARGDAAHCRMAGPPVPSSGTDRAQGDGACTEGRALQARVAEGPVRASAASSRNADMQPLGASAHGFGRRTPALRCAHSSSDTPATSEQAPFGTTPQCLGLSGAAAGDPETVLPWQSGDRVAPPGRSSAMGASTAAASSAAGSGAPLPVSFHRLPELVQSWALR